MWEALDSFEVGGGGMRAHHLVLALSLLAPAASDPSELLLEQPVIKLLLGATHRHRNFPRLPGRRCMGRKRLGRKCLDPECKRREGNGRGGSGARGAVECRRVLPSSLPAVAVHSGGGLVGDHIACSILAVLVVSGDIGGGG